VDSLVFIDKVYSLKYPILSAPNLQVTHIYSMSNEILPGKLSSNPAVSAESRIVVKEKKKRGSRGLLLFLMAVGLGAVALTSITLLSPVAFYGRVDSPGSIDSSGSKGDGSAVISTALAASATATDGKGVAIEANGLTKSADMTITGYSDSRFSTELRCLIDSQPMYCSGSPVTLSGLPPGEHVFTVMEPVHDKITVQSFGWEISE
jgi:hypothetical protein